MVIKFILLVLGAYLLGSVPTAYLVAKWLRGIDIRRYGSGNIGASNVLTSISIWWSGPVAFFDLAKGAIVVWVAQLLGLDIAQQIAVGLAAIIGHNWPVFLRFSGGRGALTSLGASLMLAPKLGLTALVLAFLFAPFGQLSLGVFIASITLPILSWFLSQPLGIEGPLPLTLWFVAIFLLTTIRRLTVPRTPLTASVRRGELIVNRLLFDRDIRDKKAWISQTRPGVSPGKQSPGRKSKDSAN